ncbi:hypothetical protein AB9K26_03925 [Psychroserpens sp. XS_ASV72]|uniref:hypothetical protein n=1 Tax=Psychroserpens sp. XS_ASV72 TaxID=3241293 RepID=UPI003517F6E7
MIEQILHKVIALTLSTVLMASNINTIVIVSDFVINQDYIAQTLCIQKEEQKGCNGKCQLRKELSQNNTESSSETPFQEQKPLVLDIFFVTCINEIKMPYLALLSRQHMTSYYTPKTIQMYLDIDTPPPNFY